MVIPHIGIAAEVINDHAAVLKAVHGVIGYGISKAGGSAVGSVGFTVAVRVRKQIVIFSVDLLNRAALVEFMLLYGQGRTDGILLDLNHIILELGCVTPGQLSPIQISLTVIINEHGRVNAPHALDLTHVHKRPCGRLGFCHAAAAVRNAVIEVVPAVTVCAVGRIQRTAILRPCGILKRKYHAVIDPVDQIIRGIHVVYGAAKAHLPLNIKRAVQVDAAIVPDVCLHVGNEDMFR